MSPTGHLAMGFVAKKYAIKIPLAVILIAAYALDLIYFVFLLLGIDHQDYDPWSHSLFMAGVWSVCAGVLAVLFTRKLRNGLVLGLVVFSHWILDFIVWDTLPVFFDSTHRIGLGFYNTIGFSLTALQFNLSTVIATSIELSMLIFAIVFAKSRSLHEEL